MATIVDYVNSTELFPLTIAQLLDLFDMYGQHNLESPKTSGKHVAGDSSEANRYLRTYELLSFVQKYLRLIEGAIKSLGPKFIQKYCIEKMKGRK